MKILGIIVLILAMAFLLHGSVKMAEAEDQEQNTIELEEGIVLVEETEAQQFANYSLTIGGILLVTGGALIYFSRKTNS